MKRVIEFLREQEKVVENWVTQDQKYQAARKAEGRPPAEGVARRIVDRQELLDQIYDAIETLEENT